MNKITPEMQARAALIQNADTFATLANDFSNLIKEGCNTEALGLLDILGSLRISLHIDTKKAATSDNVPRDT